MFSKGLIGYLPANILQGVVGFVTLMVFTRVLSPTDYGAYVLALGATNIAYTLTFTWLEAAMARYYPAERRTDPEAPVLYGTVYRTFALVALAFAPAVVAVMALWPVHDAADLTLKTAVGAGLASTVPRSLAKLVQEQRRSEGRVAMAAGIDMLTTSGGLVLAVVFALMGLKAAAPLLAAGATACLILPFVVREDWGRALKGRFEAPAARAYAHYGYPISLSLIMTICLYTVDRFMIAHYLTEADAGAYHAGFSVASRVIDVVFIWFGAAGVPAMNHALETGGDLAIKTEARRQITLMALVQFPAVAGLISVAAPLSSVLIGGALRGPALAITPLVTVGALLAGMNNGYFLLPFTLAKKTRRLIVAMSVPAAANIALNVALIPVMGLEGAALSYVASFAIGIATSWALAGGVGRLPLPLLELAKIGGAAAVMAAALMALPSFGVGVDLALKPMVGAGLYGLIVYVLDLGGARAFADGLLSRLAPRLQTGS